MTTQELPERRAPKIDLNLLPDEYLPRKKSRWGLLLVLLVVVLACVPWPFLIMKSDVDADNRRLEAEQASLQAEFNAIMKDAVEAADLQKKIDGANAGWNDILADWELFQASIRTWSEIMYDVQQLPRGSLGYLESITQNKDTITIVGWFAREQFIYEYSLMLADTGHFIEDGVNIKQKKLDENTGAHDFTIEAILVPAEVEE
jgi:hypothetical protein